jgi:hypothetical protein
VCHSSCLLIHMSEDERGRTPQAQSTFDTALAALRGDVSLPQIIVFNVDAFWPYRVHPSLPCVLPPRSAEQPTVKQHCPHLSAHGHRSLRAPRGVVRRLQIALTRPSHQAIHTLRWTGCSLHCTCVASRCVPLCCVGTIPIHPRVWPPGLGPLLTATIDHLWLGAVSCF